MKIGNAQLCHFNKAALSLQFEGGSRVNRKPDAMLKRATFYVAKSSMGFEGASNTLDFTKKNISEIRRASKGRWKSHPDEYL